MHNGCTELAATRHTCSGRGQLDRRNTCTGDAAGMWHHSADIAQHSCYRAAIRTAMMRQYCSDVAQELQIIIDLVAQLRCRWDAGGPHGAGCEVAIRLEESRLIVAVQLQGEWPSGAIRVQGACSGVRTREASLLEGGDSLQEAQRGHARLISLGREFWGWQTRNGASEGHSEAPLASGRQWGSYALRRGAYRMRRSSVSTRVPTSPHTAFISLVRIR